MILAEKIQYRYDPTVCLQKVKSQKGLENVYFPTDKPAVALPLLFHSRVCGLVRAKGDDDCRQQKKKILRHSFLFKFGNMNQNRRFPVTPM